MYEPSSAKLRVPRFSRPTQVTEYPDDTPVSLKTTLLFVILSDIRPVDNAGGEGIGTSRAFRSGSRRVRFIAPFVALQSEESRQS
jgi:hypothetical protein